MDNKNRLVSKNSIWNIFHFYLDRSKVPQNAKILKVFLEGHHFGKTFHCVLIFQ